MREGQYEMVLKAVNNILQIDPDNVEAHKLHSQVLCLSNQVEKAIKILTDF